MKKKHLILPLLILVTSLTGCNIFPSSSIISGDSTISNSTGSSDSVDERTLKERLESSVITVSSSFNNSQKWTSLGYASSYEESKSLTSEKKSSGLNQDRTSYISRNNTEGQKDDKGVYYRLSDSLYGDNGASFRINMIDGSEGPAIYKGAVYTDMDDVAAYLYAFGELPVNMDYDSGDKRKSISDWGTLGRVNNTAYSNDNSIEKFKFEPEAWTHSIYFDKRESTTDYWYYYVETDYGPASFNEESYVSGPGTYNNGKSINRGVSRFIYTAAFTNNEHSDSKVKKIENVLERHVFYTYNHYNDFQEYLNYYGGWNKMYGNMTAGNEYREINSSNPPSEVEPFTWTTLDMLKK